MYKRALMLTAATIALLAEPALGATTLTDKTTAKLQTSTTGDLILGTVVTNGAVSSSGTIVIPSSSQDSTAPVVEINSNNSVTLTTATNNITYTGTSQAIGIQQDVGTTGQIVNFGVIDLTGVGSTKTGILFGNPLLAAGTITGTADTTAGLLNGGRITSFNLVSGSKLSVVGDGSYGIHLTTGDTLQGDVVVAGALTTQATSITSTTAGVPVTAIELDGALGTAGTPSNLNIQTGGSAVSVGAGALGVVVLGPVQGQIINSGTIDALGTTSPTTTKPNPEAGSALIIANNVSGGLYFGGPVSSADATLRSTVEATGISAAINIVPGYSSTTVAPITIGGSPDPQSVFGTVSFLNRGTVSAVPTNVDDSSLGITISGASPGNTTTFTNGIVNSGTINSTATTDLHSTVAVGATALTIGNYAVIAPVNGPVAAALINSNESTSGVISAVVSGTTAGNAFGINIQQFGNLPSIVNQGTISATAQTSDTTVATENAVAIIDQSGTLLNINNSGTISALATTLDNKAQVSQAINLGAAAGNVTITNTGGIVGDVLLGAGSDTLTVTSTTTTPASIVGNINFGGSSGGNDTFVINGTRASVTGNVLEQLGGEVAVSVQNGATLNVTNNGLLPNGAALPASTKAGLTVTNLSVDDGSTLGLTVAQPFNQAISGNVGPIVTATNSININQGALVNLTFGSFISTNSLSSATPAQFIVFDAPTGALSVNSSSIVNSVNNGIPFLFTGGLCSVNASISGVNACSAPPTATTRSQLVLQLAPKTADQIGLTGYASKMFTFANAALSNDAALGAQVIAAGAGLAGTADQIQTNGQKIYQGIYSSFAPDVTGASRAVAISLTDQASGPVGARQRALRMYAGQDGEATLWGQEFAQRVNVGNTLPASGYNNSGFGFALGLDTGSPASGRYGAAFTFFSGDTSEKAPRHSKTTSEWYMLTGYSDWRAKSGLFVDGQISAGYGTLKGKRSLVIDGVCAGTNNNGVCRVANSKRGAALLSGGVTAGMIYNSGGTVFIPHVSLDALTLREAGYKESNNKITTATADGFDLDVKPSYSNSIRAFAGADLRQDLNFGDFFFQPEVRVGYRYDFLDGATKLKGNFISVPNSQFTLTGPDPAKGNVVLGGGFAVTTGAWSIGLNYDYLRGEGGGVGGTSQTGTISLIGRI